MKIVHVGHKLLAAREFKLATTEREQGLDCYALSVRPIQIECLGPFTKTYQAQSPQAIPEMVRMIDQEIKPDLYHFHNEQDYVLLLIKQGTDRPVIWDIHDLISRLRGFQAEDEQECFAVADGILCCSEHLAEITEPLTKGQPIDYYRTLCPRSWFPQPQDATEADLIIPTGLVDPRTKPGHYRDWHDTFKRAVEDGVSIDVFSASTECWPQYTDTGAVFRELTFGKALIGKLANYHAGLCGAPGTDGRDHIRHTFPNKLTEPIAAGIPVLCLGTDLNMHEVIKAYGVGLGVDDAKDIKGAVDELKGDTWRKRVLEVRDEFALETDWPRVEKMYREVLA